MEHSAARVLALVGDNSGPSLWRIWLPFTELQRRGVFAHWKHVQDPELHDPVFKLNVTLKFDAVILARMSWRERIAAVEQIASIRGAGVAVIVETDDDMFSPGIVGRQHAVFDRERDKGLD